MTLRDRSTFEQFAVYQIGLPSQATELRNEDDSKVSRKPTVDREFAVTGSCRNERTPAHRTDGSRGDGSEPRPGPVADPNSSRGACATSLDAGRATTVTLHCHSS